MPTISSLGKSLNAQVNQRTSDALIIALKDDDSPGDARVLQYFPESLSDTKANNYQPKEVFGGSLPVYQWSAGGERVVSFTATFSCDVDLLENDNLAADLKAAGEERRNIDIRSAILWLRRFQFPRYDQGALGGSAVLTHAPPKLILSLPNTGIGIAGGDDGLRGPDSLIAFMSQCDVTWEKFFPSNLPRLASVQLAFTQVAQLRGQISFPSRTDNMDYLIDGSREASVGSERVRFFGYNLRPKGVVR